eukprot:336125-Pelagomonas_calceolata.AAC.1
MSDYRPQRFRSAALVGKCHAGPKETICTKFDPLEPFLTTSNHSANNVVTLSYHVTNGKALAA